jgi:hypothetical protein
MSFVKEKTSSIKRKDYTNFSAKSDKRGREKCFRVVVAPSEYLPFFPIQNRSHINS